VHRVLAVLAGAGASAERPLPLHCLVETAAGLEQAHAIATASAAVHGLSLGEADLSSDLGATGQGLDWARSRVIVAARAAGLPRPPQSVHPDVRDTEGLARSCRHGRALGHLGRAAIHPAQLAVIEAAYLPGPAEVAAARAALEGYRAALDAGQGAAALADGRFVDEAVVGAARFAVRLAEAYGTGADDP
jgi:citrate lyase subunit beta/citryl-CoA lyase